MGRIQGTPLADTILPVYHTDEPVFHKQAGQKRWRMVCVGALALGLAFCVALSSDILTTSLLASTTSTAPSRVYGLGSRRTSSPRTSTRAPLTPVPNPVSQTVDSLSRDPASSRLSASLKSPTGSNVISSVPTDTADPRVAFQSKSSWVPNVPIHALLAPVVGFFLGGFVTWMHNQQRPQPQAMFSIFDKKKDGKMDGTNIKAMQAIFSSSGITEGEMQSVTFEEMLDNLQLDEDQEKVLDPKMVAKYKEAIREEREYEKQVRQKLLELQSHRRLLASNLAAEIAANKAEELAALEEAASLESMDFSEDDNLLTPTASMQEEDLQAKIIYILSDCTGESAANTVRAALGQFQLKEGKKLSTKMIIHRFIETDETVFKLVREAAESEAMVVYTLVDTSLRQALVTASQLYKIKTCDIWTQLLDEMQIHLQKSPLGVPRGLEERPKSLKLTPDYYKMIESVEFTRRADDGANPNLWHEADILLLGVSRSGKTPLSIYLGQRGFKCANLPLVPGAPMPKQIHEIDQRKVFGLIIEANVLANIRKNRTDSMGAGGGTYDSVKGARDEIMMAKRLYNENPDWMILNTTHTSIEESAARIMRQLARIDLLPPTIIDA